MFKLQYFSADDVIEKNHQSLYFLKNMQYSRFLSSDSKLLCRNYISHRHQKKNKLLMKKKQYYYYYIKNLRFT